MSLGAINAGILAPVVVRGFDEVRSDDFTRALGAIPAMNAQLAGQLVGDLAGIGMQERGATQRLKMQQQEARRSGRLRMAGEFLANALGGGGSTGQQVQWIDPVQAQLAGLDFSRQLKDYGAYFSQGSRDATGSSLNLLGGS